jgi:hypothetical protein
MPLEHEPLSFLGEGTARSSFSFIHSFFFFCLDATKKDGKKTCVVRALKDEECGELRYKGDNIDD